MNASMKRVYAVMYWPGGSGSRSLCAIFSTRKRAERFIEALEKKRANGEGVYSVDAWHVNGAIA